MSMQQTVSTYQPSITHDGSDAFGAKGLRQFFDYRDLGIKDATDSEYNVYLVRAKPDVKKSTGWHYHTCELQVVYCLKGWEDIALEDGRIVRLLPGSCLNIPPGYRHSEVAYSDDMEVMVMTKPAQIGTTPVPRPPNAPEGT